MKNLIFLFLVFSMTAMAATDPKKVCDADSTNAKLLRDWKRNEKGRYCLEAACTTQKGITEREKCFFQSEGGQPNVVFVSTSDYTTGSSRSRAAKVILNGEEKCTDACMEGVKKKSCQECFRERALEYKEEEFINYPEIGKPLRRGTKCYYACLDKEGPIQKTRVLSQECISCIGMNGAVPESFEYLQTMGGACFEIDNTRHLFRVNAKMCQDAGNKLHRTTYQTSRSVTQWLFNASSSCYEVDEMTKGLVVKIEVNSSKCGNPDAVNDSDRNLIKEQKTTTTPVAGSKSSNQ